MSKSQELLASVPIEDYFNERMADPAFAKAYADLQPEFNIIRQIIELRLERGLTQSDLAKRIGAPQPSISRLESRQRTHDLSFLSRIANALGAKLEIKLTPLETSTQTYKLGRNFFHKESAGKDLPKITVNLSIDFSSHGSRVSSSNSIEAMNLKESIIDTARNESFVIVPEPTNSTRKLRIPTFQLASSTGI